MPDNRTYGCWRCPRLIRIRVEDARVGAKLACNHCKTPLVSVWGHPPHSVMKGSKRVRARKLSKWLHTQAVSRRRVQKSYEETLKSQP